jgi:hypothetical protein
MIQSRMAVATIAPAVAPMTWPMAAPPAGGSPAAIVEMKLVSTFSPSDN